MIPLREGPDGVRFAVRVQPRAAQRHRRRSGRRPSNLLLSDQDDMVQKGLGWLLRETAKADFRRTVPYLMKIRDRAPRRVRRTACETLPPGVRTRILSKRLQ